MGYKSYSVSVAFGDTLYKVQMFGRNPEEAMAEAENRLRKITKKIEMKEEFSIFGIYKYFLSPGNTINRVINAIPYP